MIKRHIQSRVENALFKGKAVILYGARQVGKTTLIKEIENNYKRDSLYLNCDEPDVRAALTDVTSTGLKQLAGGKRMVFIDEAQRVKNIGITLKLFVDQLPGVQVVSTGSSSLDLSNEIAEPLTGRAYEFHLFPFSLAELQSVYSPVELKRMIESRMVLGMYPDIVLQPGEAPALLRSLSASYLYKDVLQYQDIRRPELLEKLLRALALQIGREVSYNELSNLLDVSKKTIENYIQLLEKAFVVFRLRPFSRNLRTELKKMRKIYFYDTGIRNALINNLNGVELRQDTGQLWENFMISERMKLQNNRGRVVNTWFWRTHRQAEVDYLEEADGALQAFEFKWKPGKRRVPKPFRDAYPDCGVEFIDRDTYGSFTGIT
ncbi:MAG TPA: ATP-binding protein [bacterium]|nr:ATP-binding protein [bacterium]